MNGIRVTGIDPQCSQRMLWQYFTDCCNQKGAVTDVFYPLLHNDAIIIFKNLKVTAQVLSSNHGKWTLQPLPHQVFTKQMVWVNMSMSKFIQRQPIHMEYLKNLGQVILQEDKITNQIVLIGEPPQIEWAWKFLSDLQDKEQFVSSKLYFGDMNSAISVISERDALTHDQEDSDTMLKTAQDGPDRTSDSKRHTEASDHASLVDYSSIKKQLTSAQEDPLVAPSGISSRLQENAAQHNEKHIQHESVGNSFIQYGMNNMEKIITCESSEENGQLKSVGTNDCDDMHKIPDLPQSQSVLETKTEKICESFAMSSSEIKRVPMVPCKTDSETKEAFSEKTDKGTIKSQPEQSHGLQSHVKVKQKNDPKKSTAYVRYLSGEDCYHDLGMTSDFQYDLLPQSTVELSRKYFDFGKRLKLKIYVDDITKARTEAVVNASDPDLRNIGGVAGALSRAAGPEMTLECEKLLSLSGPLMTAQVTKTKAYGKLSHLKCIIHTVGPVFVDGQEDKAVFELTQTFLNCMEYAAKNKLQSLAFPFISTGIFGMPIESSIHALVASLKLFENKQVHNLKEIHFINNDINVVCEAILYTESLINAVTLQSCLKQMEEGKKLYGRNVYPYCIPFLIYNFGFGPLLRPGHSGKKKKTWESPRGREEHELVHQPWCPSRVIPPVPDSVHFSFGRVNSQPEYLPPLRYPSSDGLNATSGQDDSDQLTGNSNSEDRPGDVLVEDDCVNNQRENQNSHQEIAGQSPDNECKYKDMSDDATGVDDYAGGQHLDLQDQKSPEPLSLPVLVLRADHSFIRSNTSKLNVPNNAGESYQPGDVVVPKQTQLVSKQSLTANFAEEESKNLAGMESERNKPSDNIGKDNHSCNSFTSETENLDDVCPICKDAIKEPKLLPCSHIFCTSCVDTALSFNAHCPECRQHVGVPMGTQPANGDMSHSIIHEDLPGYENCGTIVIQYSIPGGVQEEFHPHPGHPYKGISRTAYLPNNREGNEVLQMLRKAFDSRMVFTVGDSMTTGHRGVITWNDIHHKTSVTGGPLKYGYPDPDYLMQVKEDLKAKGIRIP